MSYKTLADYDDEQLTTTRAAKDELVSNQHTNDIRSVRTTVNRRYDVPELRVEMRSRSFTVSVLNTVDDHGLGLLTAMVTQDGTLVGFFGDKSASGDTNSGGDDR